MEEIVERVSHDAALADFQVDQRVVVNVVETHLVRDGKPALQHVLCHSRPIKPISQLRFDYDTTTIRRYHYAFDYITTEVIEITICVRFDCDTTTTRHMFIFCSRRIASNGSRRARYVVVSQSNRNFDHFRDSVVVECVVVSSYRSRIVVESQL